MVFEAKTSGAVHSDVLRSATLALIILSTSVFLERAVLARLSEDAHI